MHPFGKIPLPAKWGRKNDPTSLIRRGGTKDRF